MRTLYLHIGNHKTGSSSIQKSLVSSKSILKKNGFRVFSEFPDGRQSIGGSFNPWIKVVGSFEQFDSEVAPRFAEISGIQKLASRLSKGRFNVVASSEYLSWIFDAQQIEKLHSLLSPHFDEIKIVAYIRRQDRQALSHVNQGAKWLESPEEKFYGATMKPLPILRPHFSLYLDYNERLGKWADAFGDKNMIIRLFHESSLKNGDVVEDFHSIMGIRPAYVAIKNISYGAERSKVGRIMNRAGLKNGRLRQMLVESIQDTRRFLPCREDAIKFYESFRGCNARLVKRFDLSSNANLFDEDFLEYPERSSDGWSGLDVDQTLLEIFECLAREEIAVPRSSVRSLLGHIKYRLFRT